MKNIYLTVVLIMLLASGVYGNDYLSPYAIVINRSASKLYIAEYTANQVVVFDLVSKKVTDLFSLPAPPSGLTLSPDESILYITSASPDGRIHLIDLNQNKILNSISVGHTPNSPVLHPDGKTLYTCNQFDNNISVIDLKSGKETDTIPVIREPVSAAITPDGNFLFVANSLPKESATSEYIATIVSVIDINSKKLITGIKLPNGSTALKGICLSPDGKYAYVTHIIARYQYPTTQVTRGWINTNALSIIDVTTKILVNTVLLDENELGVANPWGVACTPDGNYICVTHAGTDELSVINRKKLHEKLNRAMEGYRSSTRINVLTYPRDIPNDLGFLVGLRRKYKLSGKGPRGLFISGTTIYIAEYFSESIGIVDISQPIPPFAQSEVLQSKQRLTIQRKGEILFHDATLCFQNWQSCASCHPEKGRPDALNWDLLNDGMGNPKNTKSLLLSYKTPPSMVTGVRDRTEMAIRAGIKHILFTERPDEDITAIYEYLKSLEPVPSPFLINEKLSEAALRGKKVFEKADCSSCHPPPLFTDLKKYNLGLGSGLEAAREFDTPTLIEIWRTSPYLFDGRAQTMNEVLTRFNQNDKHGKTTGLIEQEINDLIEYILSL